MGDQVLEPENNRDNNEEIEKAGSIQWVKLLKVFLFRVPLWSVALLLIVIFGWMGYNNLTTEDPVNLRPLISNAVKSDITITICNERVDELNINPRKEELALAKKFREREDVKDARVSIERKDCDK